MQLNLYGANLSETLLTELYGWGEVPFDWLNDRATEFEAIAASSDIPTVMTSHYQGSEGNDWQHVFVLPALPDSDAEHNLVTRAQSLINQLPNGLFRVEHVHAGVRCIAFM